MGEMNIGCRVRVNSHEGVIVDKMHSEKSGKTLYEVEFNIHGKKATKMCAEDQLEVVELSFSKFDFKFEVADNVVVCICTEDGEEIGRGHGHIIHEGRVGFVQAASYAIKRMYERMNGGTTYGQNRRQVL